VWVPQFCGRARGATPSRFYESLIELLHAFVIHEADYVRAVLKRSEQR
jgi:TorA maturation chaperone TorD